MQEQYPAPCVGSGRCCKRSACAFGEYDHEAQQCRYLVVEQRVEGLDIFGCSQYAFIVEQPGAQWNPAFGAGCCQSLFNEHREAIITVVGKGSATRAAISLGRPTEEAVQLHTVPRE